MKTDSARQQAVVIRNRSAREAAPGRDRPIQLQHRSVRRRDAQGRRGRAAGGRRALVSARRRLTTVGEVVLDGLLSGLAAVAAVALIAAASLTMAVLLLEWWF